MTLIQPHPRRLPRVPAVLYRQLVALNAKFTGELQGALKDVLLRTAGLQKWVDWIQPYLGTSQRNTYISPKERTGIRTLLDAHIRVRVDEATEWLGEAYQRHWLARTLPGEPDTAAAAATSSRRRRCWMRRRRRR